MKVVLLFILFLTGCISPKIGVVKGDNFFSKTLFFHDLNMTAITNIKAIDLCTVSNPTITIFDQFSMNIIDVDTRVVLRKINFKKQTGTLSPIIVSKNCEEYEIVAKDILGDIEIINQQGEVSSIYKTDNIIVNDLSTADLNNDGEVEFYVATNKGIHQVNSQGKKNWEQGQWIRNVIPFNEDTEGEHFIVGLLDGRNLQFRDYYGKLIRETKTEEKIDDLEICNWPSSSHFIASKDRNRFMF